MKWIAVPVGHAPAVSSADSFYLYGWSGGYVDFVMKSNKTIVPWYSADGLNWHAGKTMATGGKSLQMTGLVEGPASIMATALTSEVRGVSPCSAGGWGFDATWISDDGGATWERLDVANAFPGGNVYDISGGPSGYVALGTVADHDAVWISTEGRTWRQADLSGETFKNTSIKGAVSLSTGLVLEGAVLGTDTDDCGNPEEVAGALWSSADGTTWTRDKVSGISAEDLMGASIERISDHALLATSLGESDDCPAWITSNGRTWTRLSSDWTAYPCGLLYTDGQRGLLISQMHDLPSDVWAFDANLTPVVLNQTGDRPTNDELWSGGALGPTGFLIPNEDGARFWLGVPTVG